MTASEWAELRREAMRRGFIARGLSAGLSRRFLDGATEPPFSPPAAGTWIRARHMSRWHRFTGDLQWGPGYIGRPALLAVCGCCTGSSRSADDDLRIADEATTPRDACRTCLRLPRPRRHSR